MVPTAWKPTSILLTAAAPDHPPRSRDSGVHVSDETGYVFVRVLPPLPVSVTTAW